MGLYDFSTYVVNKQSQAEEICSLIQEYLHADECPNFYSVHAEWRNGLWTLLIGAGAFLAGHIVLWIAERKDEEHNDLQVPLNHDTLVVANTHYANGKTDFTK